MKQITIREKQYEAVTDWREVSMENYLKIVKIYEDKTLINEEKMLYLVPILTNISLQDCYGFYDEDFIPFSEILKENLTTDKFVKENKELFYLNGRNYIVVNPNRLTFGETVTLKQLEKNSSTMEDRIYNILSIIVRPAEEKPNEFGEKIYEPCDFDADPKILEKRKEVLKQIPAVNALYIVDAFISGRKKL